MRADNIRRANTCGRSALLLRPERRFWLIIGLITLGGGALRLLMHDYFLPWYGHGDEGRIVRGVLGLRGLLPPEIYKELKGYPPLTLWVHELAQLNAEAQGRPFATDALLDLRRFFMLFNIAGIYWSALLGRHCGGALAGILAAALWAISHIMLDLPVHTLGEALAYPLFILSVLLAVQALDPRRRWQLTLASLGVATLVFLLEYRLVIAFFPGVAVLIQRARTHYRPGWQRIAFLVGIVTALMILATTVVLSQVPPHFHDVITRALSERLWDLPGVVEHLRQALVYAGAQILNEPLTNFSEALLPQVAPHLTQAFERPEFLPLLLIAVLAPLAWLRGRAQGQSPLNLPVLLLLCVTLLLALWADSAIRPYSEEVDLKLRHAIPAVTLILVLMAAALAQLVAAVPGRRARAGAGAILVSGLILLLTGPALELEQERRRLPWPVIVRPWVDANLEPGTILVYHESERWFNPFWSGIPHRQWFDWLETEDVLERPLQEWIETHKITWLALPVTERDRLQGSDEGRAFLAQLLPLRDFTGPPRRSGIEVGLYRLWRMQQESDIRFGDHIRLVGHDVHDPDPGGSLSFTFYWNAPTRPPVNYSLFLHLVAADGTSPFAQVDGNPAVPERLTQTWDRADETLISPRFTLTLPPDLAPGDYRILLGLYNFETGARLPLQDAQGNPAGDAWEVTQLRIPDSYSLRRAQCVHHLHVSWRKDPAPCRRSGASG